MRKKLLRKLEESKIALENATHRFNFAEDKVDATEAIIHMKANETLIEIYKADLKGMA